MILIAITLWMKATFWGLVSGSALVIGALLAYFTNVPKKLIAFIMAFGSGVLISALAFDLMNEAYKRGGFDSTAIGFFFSDLIDYCSYCNFSFLRRNII